MIHSGCEFHGLRSECIDVPWLTDIKILNQFHRQFLASLMLNSHLGGVSQEDGHINSHRAPHSLSVRWGLKVDWDQKTCSTNIIQAEPRECDASRVL